MKIAILKKEIVTSQGMQDMKFDKDYIRKLIEDASKLLSEGDLDEKTTTALNNCLSEVQKSSHEPKMNTIKETV